MSSALPQRSAKVISASADMKIRHFRRLRQREPLCPQAVGGG
jgi:hypothetical protein